MLIKEMLIVYWLRKGWGGRRELEEMDRRTGGFKTEEDPQDPHGERAKPSKLSLWPSHAWPIQHMYPTDTHKQIYCHWKKVQSPSRPPGSATGAFTSWAICDGLRWGLISGWPWTHYIDTNRFRLQGKGDLEWKENMGSLTLLCSTLTGDQRVWSYFCPQRCWQQVWLHTLTYNVVTWGFGH